MGHDQSGHIEIDKPFTLDTVVLASRGAELGVSPVTIERLNTQRRALVSTLQKGERRLYGFNTGFGDNRNRPMVPLELCGVIQDNLILSHAAGTGEPLEPEVVRAAMALRAHSLAIGNSGVRGALVRALCDLANTGLVPVVPRFGSVGASGDLAPLSHMVLPLLATGRVIDGGGARDVDVSMTGSWKLAYRPSDEFAGVEGPVSTFGPKEGLALNNGTAFMAAHLALAVYEMESALWHADLALAMNLEAMGGVIDAHREDVQSLRPHRGINACAARIRAFLADSKLVVRGGAASDTVQAFRTKDGVFDSTQDDYCLRSGPVVHGTAWDAVHHAHQVVETEINAVTDNPVVIEGEVYSGSHFHGMPLAFAADQLRTAMAIVGGISERRIAKLMNDKRSYGLPRHLVINDDDGVKSGWMIAQYTAASMVNELKTRAMPYCVGNVTTGNESEDFVSMGANACRAAYECVAVLRGIVAIELAAAARALTIRLKAGVTEGDLSSASRAVLQILASHECDVSCPTDRPLEPTFSQVAELVQKRALRPSP